MRVRTPSWSELAIHSEDAQHGPTIYSTVRARMYLQHGCSCLMAYVLDTWEEGKETGDDVGRPGVSRYFT